MRITGNTECLLNFVYRNDLHISWKHPNASCDLTYVNHSLKQKSTIAHFIVGTNIFVTIIDNEVIFNPINPVQCNFPNNELSSSKPNIYFRSRQYYMKCA